MRPTTAAAGRSAPHSPDWGSKGENESAIVEAGAGLRESKEAFMHKSRQGFTHGDDGTRLRSQSVSDPKKCRTRRSSTVLIPDEEDEGVKAPPNPKP